MSQDSKSQRLFLSKFRLKRQKQNIVQHHFTTEFPIVTKTQRNTPERSCRHQQSEKLNNYQSYIRQVYENRLKPQNQKQSTNLFFKDHIFLQDMHPQIQQKYFEYQQIFSPLENKYEIYKDQKDLRKTFFDRHQINQKKHIEFKKQLSRGKSRNDLAPWQTTNKTIYLL
ncbi:hypothetical protein pb186bvf_001501 [Paramecium bursaria]